MKAEPCGRHLPGWEATGQEKVFIPTMATSWKNYNIATAPQLNSNDCFTVSMGPNNSKWIGFWGSPVV